MTVAPTRLAGGSVGASSLWKVIPSAARFAGDPMARGGMVHSAVLLCPFCARLQPTLDEARNRYGDRLRFVYRHFPLSSIHPHAWKAAEASLCAHDQGRFWEMHDLLFAEQDSLGIVALNEKAARLGLDAEAFDVCLDSRQHHETVLADVLDGEALGVTGTPTMFINGRLVSGAVPIEELAAVIDDELRRTKE